MFREKISLTTYYKIFFKFAKNTTSMNEVPAVYIHDPDVPRFLIWIGYLTLVQSQNRL